MAGISTKALNGGTENKYKFNSGSELATQEFSDNTGLDLYETTFRNYDGQIGRFHQIDLLAEITSKYSPYVFCFNNPIIINDPTGLLGDTTIDGKNYSMVTLPGVTASNGINIPRISPSIKPIQGTVSARISESSNSNILQVGLLGIIRTNPQAAATVGLFAAGGLTIYQAFFGQRGLYADGAIPYPGFLDKDNTALRPITIPPESLVGPDNPAIPRTVLPPAQPTNVYEIGGWDIAKMKWETLKYGVASAKYDTYGGLGNRRPDSQLGGALGEQLRAKYPHLFIRQIKLATFPDKLSAHIFENNMVVQYTIRHGERPPEQDLPTGIMYK